MEKKERKRDRLRFVKKVFNLTFLPSDQQSYVTVCYTIPDLEKEDEEDGKEFIEVQFGVKISQVIKSLCTDHSLDEDLYVLTFGNSDKPIEGDMEIQTLNCNDFCLQNKSILNLGSSKSEEEQTLNSDKSSKKKSSKMDRFSEPFRFTQLNDLYQPCGTLSIQVNSKYLIYAKVVDHEPLRYSVLDKTKRCMAIDLGQEMKSILTGNPEKSEEFSRISTLRTINRNLLLLSDSEKEKRKWIHNLNSIYSKNTPIYNASDEKRFEDKAIGKMIARKLPEYQKEISHLKQEIQEKAKKHYELCQKLENFQQLTSALENDVKQEIDNNTIRFNTCSEILNEHQKATFQMEEACSKASNNSTFFQERVRKLKETKESVELVHKIEIDKMKWKTFIQGLVIFVIVWFIIKLFI